MRNLKSSNGTAQTSAMSRWKIKAKRESGLPGCQGTERGGVGSPPADGSVGIFAYHRDVSIAGQFIAELRNASDLTLSAAIGAEIDRLSREAATLRKLRDNLFGVA
jgi:hypothetical protein